MAKLLLVNRFVFVFAFFFGCQRIDFVLKKLNLFLVKVIEQKLVVFGVLRLAEVVMAL
jgi:hypothetical protein